LSVVYSVVWSEGVGVVEEKVVGGGGLIMYDIVILIYI